MPDERKLDEALAALASDQSDAAATRQDFESWFERIEAACSDYVQALERRGKHATLKIDGDLALTLSVPLPDAARPATLQVTQEYAYFLFDFRAHVKGGYIKRLQGHEPIGLINEARIQERLDGLAPWVTQGIQCPRTREIP